MSKVRTSKPDKAGVDRRKLILASNRGPIQFERDGDGRRKYRRGAGGLITALNSALAQTQAQWVAAAMTDEDRAVAREGDLIAFPEEDPQYQLTLVDIDPKTYELYYNEISNKTLWFLQHYLFDAVEEPRFDPELNSAWREGYVKVNQKFASAVDEIIGDNPEPMVMIHDYHLYLVAGTLRQLRPGALLFHFIHIPWCGPDYFKFLPKNVRREILESLLANDIVGFHSRRYVKNFIHCCEEFLDCQVDYARHQIVFGNRTIRARAYPISVSTADLLDLHTNDEVRAEAEEIAMIQGDCRLIARIDRAELSKNLIRGFDAYALLLEEQPELRGKVKFLAYAYPTRQGLAAYRKYQKQIETKVRQINTTYGLANWVPIELDIDDNYHRSVAAMMNYDVLLTNPIFDGMNLVAKEAAILNQRDGVIVLSENAGAYEELREGVLGINPFDVEETKTKLFEALIMSSEERRERSEILKNTVSRNDVLKWLEDQLADFEKIWRSRNIRRTELPKKL